MSAPWYVGWFHQGVCMSNVAIIVKGLSRLVCVSHLSALIKNSLHTVYTVQ